MAALTARFTSDSELVVASGVDRIGSAFELVARRHIADGTVQTLRVVVCHKSELILRPIWHHKEDRVQAHVLFSFLAYAMWKMLELWMSRCGLGNGPRPLIEEFERIKTNDVVLPTSSGREVRIRCVTQTDASQRTLLSRLGLKIPTRLGEPQWRPGSQM